MIGKTSGQGLNHYNINDWARRYLTEGRCCLEVNRGHPIVEAILAGERAGFDIRSQIHAAMAEIGNCYRLQKEIKSVRQGLFIRLSLIAFAVFSLRHLILMPVPESVWIEWMGLDRLASAALIVVLGSSLYIWLRNDMVNGLVRMSDRFASSWFVDYLVVSPGGAGVTKLSMGLRAARVGEIIAGTDGFQLSQRLYLDALSEHVGCLRQHLDRLPLISMCIEISMFSLLTFGWLLIPFVAWLESRSGGG